MEVIQVADPEEAGRCAADLIDDFEPRVLGVATGATPQLLYRQLVTRRCLTRSTILCLLDEYIGLPADHPQRYRHAIEEQLGDPLGLEVIAPDVDATDVQVACDDYEARVDAMGGVDVQILGIGRNGHIAFNEPGTCFDRFTHVAELSAATRADNARFFNSATEVPRYAITQGIGTIRRAKRIVVIATGDSKARAVAAMLDGPISIDLPASALRDHRDVVVIADAAALAMRAQRETRSCGTA